GTEGRECASGIRRRDQWREPSGHFHSSRRARGGATAVSSGKSVLPGDPTGGWGLVCPQEAFNLLADVRGRLKSKPPAKLPELLRQVAAAAENSPFQGS